MEVFVTNIEEETLDNDCFRRVLFTAPHSQLVVMSIEPGEDIGMEVHKVDQFIRIESGEARFILNGEEYEVEDDWAVVIPAGTEHNVINIGADQLKLYTIYSPAQHPDKTIHPTKQDAVKAEMEEERQ